MQKKIIIIDNDMAQCMEIARILASNKQMFYPTRGEYSNFFAFIKPIADNPQEKSAELVSHFIEKGIEPLLFIIDVSLEISPADQKGITLYEHAIRKEFPNVPYLFVTHFTEKEVGREVPQDAKLVYKPKFEVDLPIAITELLSTGPTDANESSQAFSEYYDRLITKRQSELDLTKKWKKVNELEKEIVKQKSSFFIWNWCIIWVFRLLIILSIGFLIYFSFVFGIVKSIKDNDLEKVNPFEFIEYLFIGPLPLIITFTFFSYYKNVFKPILMNERGNNDMKKMSSMLDISITKYLFASILFSALIVSLLDIFSRIFTEPVNTKLPLDKVTVLPPDNVTVIGLSIGAGLLLLLIVYILKIEKHVSVSTRGKV